MRSFSLATHPDAVPNNSTAIRRVLIVWPEYPPSIGGMQVQGESFAWYLKSQGIEVIVVCDSPSNLSESSCCAEYDATSQLTVLRVLVRKEFDSSLMKLKEIATATLPDVVYASHLAFAPAFEGIVPVVCRTAANDILRPWVGPYDISPAAMDAVTSQEQQYRVEGNKSWCQTAASFCKVLICNTKWTATKLQFLSISEFEVITGGVDTNLFAPRNSISLRSQLEFKSCEFLILVAGRHVKKKHTTLL
jgi:glycosyltransferase involved in cell wall biosynthesis